MRRFIWLSLWGLTLLTVAQPVLGDATTNGLNGINVPMALTGAGIGIGQVEQSRPGLPGFDAAGRVHTSVVPAAVFRMDGAANTADAASSTDPHPEEVAGIMISTDTTLRGVAPSASLYASAYVTTGTNPGYQDALISMQYVSQQPNVWAVNSSWNKPNTEATLDSNSQLTLGTDWIASHYNNLQVIAGVETGPPNPIPTDNYNGMTIAYSEPVSGVWRQVGSDNIFNQQPNRGTSLISLIAPGDGFAMTDPGNMTTLPPPNNPAGTSFAAPQVTGAAALLQQLAQTRINNNVPRWFPDAQNHQVIKAVLMNSADKLIDNHTVMVNGNLVPQGGLLGMTRTVIDRQGNNWLSSEAYGDGVDDGGGAIPLDDQMGAGHLNVTRAAQQFSPGEYDAGSGNVAPIGWDFGHTSGTNSTNIYPIAGSLTANHFISITLAWDRRVEFSNDANGNNNYDRGDTFQPSTSTDPQFDSDDLINNLALYLLPKGSSVIQDAVAASFAGGGTLQHLFFQLPTTAE
jgi:hypothetical protein